MSRISGQARRAIIASTVATLTLGAAHANVFVTYSDAYSVAAEALLLNTITGTASKAEPTLGAPVELADSESIAIASADFSNGIPSIADPYAEISITPTLPKGAASVTFQASAEVEYAFSIKQATFGPQPSTIKVDVIGSFEGGDATMVTTASVSVLNQNQIPLASENEYQNNFNPLPGSPFVSSPFTLTVDVIPGAVYEVVAEASGGGCISIVTEGICSTPAARYSGTYTSTIDPYVTVDPSMAGDYDLTLGSGLAPPVSDAVPEAATWGMMLTGFAGLGFVGYWRKQKGGAPTLAV